MHYTTNLCILSTAEKVNSAAAALERDVRDFLLRNGRTEMDVMQQEFGGRYRAVNPQPWSLRTWLSALRGVERGYGSLQLCGQGQRAASSSFTSMNSRGIRSPTVVLFL